MNTKQLRQKILDLAIRGKLVPQDPNDEPASVLLERIRAEKERLVKAGKIKADKAKTTTDKPHYGELPDGWAWCKVGDIADAVDPQPSHRTPPTSNDGIPYVGISECDYSSRTVVFSSARKVGQNVLDEHKNRYTLKQGDFIIGKIGTIGKPFFVPMPQDYALSANIVLLQPEIDKVNPAFLFFQFSSSDVERQFFKDSRATTQAAFGILRVRNIDVVLPPLAEQSRIVSAIESAFAIIDDVERNKSDLQVAVTAAKSKILSLAISGKLVPQDPNDEPTSVLLERIRAERETLIKAGKIKRGKTEKEVTIYRDNSHYGKLPFDLPETWERVRICNICEPQETRKPTGKSFSYIDIDAIDNKRHCVSKPKIIPTSQAPSRAAKGVRFGDTLFSMVRPYLENIAFITSELDDCIASTGFYICRPKTVAVFPRYLYYFLTSPYAINEINSYMRGDNSPAIRKDEMDGIFVPLPPLEEQKHIVAAIEAAFVQIENIAENLN